MSALTLFLNGAEQIRATADEKGNPWFVAADVCRSLEIANHNDAVSSLDDDEKGVATTDTLGGEQVLRTVSEAGLYQLVFRSRKPEAKAFRRWITHEVIPAIRKTGGYSMKLPQTFAESLRMLADSEEKKAALLIENAELKPKAEFFDAVAKSEDTLGMNEVAKILGTGRTRLMATLRNARVFRKNNTPFQEYLERGYFKVIESKYTDSKGDSHVTLSTRVFQRGIEFIRRQIASLNGVPA